MAGITRYFVPGLVLGVAGTLVWQQQWHTRWDQPVTHTPAIEQPVRDTSCIVSSITDGDTLRCGELRVRLLGIDTPERSQGALGDSATAALERLAPVGSRVVLEYDREREDRYGRTLAYVYNEQGYFVNEQLVRGGYAVQLTYQPNDRHELVLDSAEADAQASGAGLWKVNGFSCTPKAHRKREC